MQTFIDSALRQEVIQGATLIKGNHIPHNRLIDSNNPFLSSDTDLAIRNHNNGTRIITADEAKTFIAATTLSHCLDGWIYLAHSVESLLKGDKGISVHLAYYSELRAAMSFLSCEGISALNHFHFCLDSATNFSIFPTGRGGIGTHRFVWEAISKYLTSPFKPKNDILKMYVYSGKTFLEWLNAIPNSSSIISDQVIKDWITEWSFDINLFSADRNLRNDVSYRPRRLKDNSTIHLTDVVQKLTSFWNLLEPSSFEKFRLLDQYLLKKFFRKIHIYIQVSLGITVVYDDMVETAFKSLRLPLTPAQKSFFSSANDHQLFISANNTANDPINGITPISIIARATLLLRLTMGYSSQIFKTAGITKNEMHFFLNNIGIDNGFWEQTQIPDDFVKLWDPVGQSISEIESWIRGRTQSPSLNELNNELANELILYKQISRAGFWGMVF